MNKKKAYPTEMKILMVCLGNICRSPLAEGILRDKVQRLGLDWEIDSAGTSGWHEGERPDQRIRQVAEEKGISLQGIHSRKLSPQDFENFDLLIAMDNSNYKHLLQMAGTNPEWKKKVKKFTEFSTRFKGEDIPDPYFEGGFHRVFDMLDEGTDGILHAYAPEFIAK